MRLRRVREIVRRHAAWLRDRQDPEARRADFRCANLDGVNFSGAELYGADFRMASLRHANFSGANLSWADLRGAQTDGANFTHALMVGIVR